MRISTISLAENSIANINSSSERYVNAQQTLGTGKKLRSPSDDPAGTTLALGLRNDLDNIDQFQSNIKNAKGFLSTTDSALQQATSLLQQARSLAVQGASQTLNQDALNGIAEQVKQAIQSLGAVGNTAYGTRYVFGGQLTTTPPFRSSSGTFAYQGGTSANANDKLFSEIGYNDLVQINKTGDSVFNNAFAALQSLQNHLQSGAVSEISRTDLAALDAALGDVITARSDAGATVKRLDARTTQHDQTNLDFKDVLSGIEDADIPKTVVDLKAAETAYQAALNAAARGFQQSLLDYLR